MSMFSELRRCGTLCVCFICVPLFLLLIYVFILSEGSVSNTQISFPKFSSTDHIMTFGDAQFEPTNTSFIVNPDVARAKATGTCGELLYGNNVRVQDVSSGKVATFSTSFSFKFTTPSNFVVWDNNTSNTEGTTFGFVFLSSEGLASVQDMISRLGRSGPCQVPEDENGQFVIPVFAVVFDTDYNNNSHAPARPTGDLSNNYIAVISTRWQEREELESSKMRYVYNLCGNETHCEYLSNNLGFTAWVDFDQMRTLEVRLANGSHPSVRKPLQPLIAIPDFVIPKQLGDHVYLTFWGSSDVNHVETHELISWNFFSSGLGSRASTFRKRIRGIIARKWVGLSVGVIGTIAAVLILCSFSWLAKPFRKQGYLDLAGLSRSCVFSYKELRKATNNFSPLEMLGTGGSGTVYRGCLDSSPGHLVAIKRITYESKSAEAIFFAEISSLNQIRHRNIVELQGWCHENRHLLLVYDYMPNGSLNEWLHEVDRNPCNCKMLSLKLRHSILEGVGSALEYLHEDGLQCILHRDVKSSNVLLDFDFKARLGDFGLAQLLDHHKVEKTTMAAGTFGYMAPEMPYTGKATKESDVYSFGVLVLEVICGRRPLDMRAQEPEDVVLLHYVWRAHEAGELLTMADPRLRLQSVQNSMFDLSGTPNLHYTCEAQHAQHLGMSNLEGNQNNMDTLVSEVEDASEVQKRMVENLLRLGLLCCLPYPRSRLSMGHVNRLLMQIGANSGNDVSMPPLPSTKPLGLYSCLEYSQTAVALRAGSHEDLQAMDPSS